MGVLQNLVKTPKTNEVRKMPSIAKRVRAIPKGSVQERNSICLGMQNVWFSLDQKFTAHFSQALASGKDKSLLVKKKMAEYPKEWLSSSFKRNYVECILEEHCQALACFSLISMGLAQFRFPVDCIQNKCQFLKSKT